MKLLDIMFHHNLIKVHSFTLTPRIVFVFDEAQELSRPTSEKKMVLPIVKKNNDEEK